MPKTILILIIGILLGILGFSLWTEREIETSPFRENTSQQTVAADSAQELEELKNAQESDDIENCKKLAKESLRFACEENIKNRKKNNELNQ